MLLYKDNSFVDTTVRLDGADYQGCSFRGCKLVYGGGPLPAFSDCAFEGCSWHLEDAAGRTVAFIRAVTHAIGPEGRAIIDNLFLRPTDGTPTPA